MGHPYCLIFNVSCLFARCADAPAALAFYFHFEQGPAVPSPSSTVKANLVYSRAFHLFFCRFQLNTRRPQQTLPGLEPATWSRQGFEDIKQENGAGRPA